MSKQIKHDDHEKLSTEKLDTVAAIMREFSEVFAFARSRWARLADELHEDLRLGGITVLQTIRRREPVTATELGNILDIDKGMVSRQVTKLRDLELVTATVDENDKRITWLSTTDDAKKSLEALHNKMALAYGERFGSWTDEELEEFSDQLKHFNRSRQAES